MNLGMVTKRDPRQFEKAFKQIDKQYTFFKSNVEKFRKNLIWDSIAKQHISIYKGIIKNKSLETLPTEMIHTPKSATRS
jgi:glycosyltransferase involved in cell wall biosynthesis